MSQSTLAAFTAATPAFEVLSNPVRQKILMTLFDRGSQTVSQLMANLNLTQSNVSYHLKQLAVADLITFVKSGRERYYSVSLARVTTLLENAVNSLEDDLKRNV